MVHPAAITDMVQAVQAPLGSCCATFRYFSFSFSSPCRGRIWHKENCCLQIFALALFRMDQKNVGAGCRAHFPPEALFWNQNLVTPNTYQEGPYTSTGVHGLQPAAIPQRHRKKVGEIGPDTYLLASFFVITPVFFVSLLKVECIWIYYLGASDVLFRQEK